MYAQEYADCLKYIDSYWERIIKDPKEAPTNNGFLKLPRRYITPNDKKFSYLFYWDTYFMFRGLIGTGKTAIMKDVVDNFVHLIKRYGIIPNFNSYASTHSSQPPFLTSMILDVFNETQGKKTLASRMEWAKLEYEQVWIDKDSTYNHSVDGYTLSKYGDRDVGYAHNAERESGWDFTSRFYNRCNEFLPIDLNCLLYKYELDFAKAAEISKNDQEKNHWIKAAEKRKKEINELMWNEEKGFYFDYDYIRGKQSKFYSLASFVPLWVGLATPSQAFRMMMHLDKFETKYGLLITDHDSLPGELQKTIDKIDHEDYRHQLSESVTPKQWDYPNIWPPVEYMAVVGMLKYGMLDEAKRIMKKSLSGEAKVFRKYGSFFEKMNGITGDAAASYHYINQGGFGWTNAVFYRYVQLLDQMSTLGDDSLYTFPMNDTAPYTLSALV